MKVLLINDRMHGGGAETVFYNNIKILSTIKEFQIYTVTASGPDYTLKSAENYIKHFQVIDSKSSFFRGIDYVFNLSNMRKMDKILSMVNPDIIHIHNFYGSISPSILYSIRKYRKRKKVKLIQTLHDYSLMCPNSSLYNYSLNTICEKCVGSRYKLHILIDKCYYGNFVYSLIKFLRTTTALNLLNHVDIVDLFIVPSEFMLHMLKKEGIKASKIRLIPNPIEVGSKLTYERFLSKKNQILYVGRLSREKGVDILIKSWKNIFSKFPDWKLIIVGDGNQRPVLVELAKDNKCIEFTGWVAQERVFELMQESKILVLPSVLYENQPSVILEAIANGVIAIVNAIGGMKELSSRYVNVKTFENIGNELEITIQETIANITKTPPLEIYTRYTQDLEKIISYHSMSNYGKEIENVYRYL